MAMEKSFIKNRHSIYYWSSRFFPKPVRDDMFKLYSFVRTVKDYTSGPTPDVAAFERLEQRWGTIRAGLAQKQVPAPLDDSVTERILANIAYLTHRHSFDPDWIDAFLKSMRWDLQKHGYRALKDLTVYMYGSSEVIGLMMARILGLPEESMKAARMQGRAMQYISFLRGIPEQNKRGFCYFPANDIKKYGLKNVSEAEARKKPGMFADFMHAELLRYAQWQAEANEGFAHIPRRLRVPLQTAVDMDNWTAQQLKYSPLAVFDQKITPHRHQVVTRAIKHSIRSKS